MEPPEPVSLIIGLLPAVGAAVFAAAGLVLTAMPHARQAALVETLSGSPRHALERYLGDERSTQARWSTLGALGLLVSATVLAAQQQAAWLCVAGPLCTFLVAAQLLSAVGRANPEGFAPGVLRLLFPIDMLLIPIVNPLVALLQRLAGGVAEYDDRSDLTETEVEIMVNEGEQNGALDHGQSEMIRNVLEFGDTQAGDVMVPRTQVTAVNVDTPPEQLLTMLTESEHSRYPVYRDSIDNIVGVLHVKDVFLFTAQRSIRELKLEQLLRNVAFVPETQLASDVLQQMRAGCHHLSIVIDEYGGMSGVITLEDLLEEIVGDIRDEYDDEEPPIVRLKGGRYLVDASIPIAELNRQAGLLVPENGEYNSLGGFIVEELGRVPEPGVVLESEGHRFTIKTSDERRISKVEISPAELQASA